MEANSHLQALDEVGVRPSHLLREAAKNAETATRRQLDYLKRSRYYHALLRVVGSRDTLKALRHDIRDRQRGDKIEEQDHSTRKTR